MAVLYIALLFSVLLIVVMADSPVHAFNKNGPIPIPGDLIFHEKAFGSHPMINHSVNATQKAK
jgi:hypothetical protein